MSNQNNNLKNRSSNYIAINLANDYKKMWFSNILYKILNILIKILLVTFVLYLFKLKKQ